MIELSFSVLVIIFLIALVIGLLVGIALSRPHDRF